MLDMLRQFFNLVGLPQHLLNVGLVQTRKASLMKALAVTTDDQNDCGDQIKNTLFIDFILLANVSVAINLKLNLIRIRVVLTVSRSPNGLRVNAASASPYVRTSTRSPLRFILKTATQVMIKQTYGDSTLTEHAFAQ